MITYIDRARAALIEALGPDHGCDDALLDLYTLLVFVAGDGVTLEDVHDAWALWRSRTRPAHPSIVPFEQLVAEVQEMDRAYAEAIMRAADVVEQLRIERQGAARS